jgi:HEAT repeat protein
MKKISILASALLLALASTADAYIDLAPTLSFTVSESPRIIAIEVTAADLANRSVTFKEISAIKGKLSESNTGTIYLFDGQSLPTQLAQWATPGSRAVLFGSAGRGLLCIGTEWYAARVSTNAKAVNTWKLDSIRPDLPLSYYGPVSQLIESLTLMQAGKDATITVVGYGADNEGASFDLALNRPNLPGLVRIQRIRARLGMPGRVMAASANPAYFIGEGRTSAGDIPKLIEDLKSKEPLTRAAAAENLGYLRGKAASSVSALEPLLKDDSAAVRFSAARALIILKANPDAALKVLEAGLTSKISAEQREAARQTGIAGAAAGKLTPHLAALLKTDDRATQFYALQAVATLGPAASEAASAVIPLLDSPDFALDAADALGRIGSTASAGLKKLAAMLESKDTSIQWAAVRGMSQIGGEDSKPAAVFMAKKLNAEFSEVDGYNMMIYLALMGPAAKPAESAIRSARIKNPVLPTATIWAMEPDKTFPWINTNAGGFRGGPMMFGMGDGGPDFAKLIYENYVHELGPRLNASAKVLAGKILDGTSGTIPEWGYGILTCSPEASKDCVALFVPQLESEQLLQRERAAVALGYMAGHAAEAKSKLESALAKTTNPREQRLLQWTLREIQKPIED